MATPHDPDAAAGYDPCDPDPDADCFRPPSIPTTVWCLHCGEVYESWQMTYEVIIDDQGRKHGFWCCGIDGCDGAGFGFDIFPVDPDYVDPDGREMGGWVDDPPPDPDTDLGRPPDEPTEVRCEKCGQTYSSGDMVWWVDDHDDPDAFVDSGWTCPTTGCDGFDFGIDIRPTDPNYVDPEGRFFLKPGQKHPPPDARGDGMDEIPF